MNNEQDGIVPTKADISSNQVYSNTYKLLWPTIWFFESYIWYLLSWTFCTKYATKWWMSFLFKDLIFVHQWHLLTDVLFPWRWTLFRAFYLNTRLVAADEKDNLNCWGGIFAKDLGFLYVSGAWFIDRRHNSRIGARCVDRCVHQQIRKTEMPSCKIKVPRMPYKMRETCQSSAER